MYKHGGSGPMKKTHIILGTIVALIMSLGINVYQFITMKAEQTKSTDLTSKVEYYEDLYSPVYRYFTSLTVDEFKAKVASGAHFTVYIGRPDCGDCNAFEPTFEEVIQDEGLANKMYYLNVKWLREGDMDEWNAFKAKYGFTQTPAFSTYEGGKQVSMIEWTDKGLPRSVLEAWLKTQGIM